MYIRLLLCFGMLSQLYGMHLQHRMLKDISLENLQNQLMSCVSANNSSQAHTLYYQLQELNSDSRVRLLNTLNFHALQTALIVKEENIKTNSLNGILFP